MVSPITETIAGYVAELEAKRLELAQAREALGAVKRDNLRLARLLQEAEHSHREVVLALNRATVAAEDQKRELEHQLTALEARIAAQGGEWG